MELIYLWVEKFRNIEKCGFNFSSKFAVKNNNGFFYIQKTLDRIENHIYHENIQNISLLVGKNGSGKSNILKLLGDQTNALETQHYIAFYWLYDDIFFIEGSCKPIDGKNSIIKNISNEYIDISKIRHVFCFYVKYHDDKFIRVDNGENLIDFHFFSTKELHKDPRSSIELFKRHNDKNIPRYYHNYGSCEYQKTFDFLLDNITKTNPISDLRYDKNIKLVISPTDIDSFYKATYLKFLAQRHDFKTAWGEENGTDFASDLQHTARVNVLTSFYEKIITLLIYGKSQLIDSLKNDDYIKQFSSRNKSPFDANNWMIEKKSSDMTVLPLQKYPPDQFSVDYRDYLLSILDKCISLINSGFDQTASSNVHDTLKNILNKIECLDNSYFVSESMDNNVEINVVKGGDNSVYELLEYVDGIMRNNIELIQDHPLRFFNMKWEPLSDGEKQYLQLSSSLYHAAMRTSAKANNIQVPTAILLLDEPDNYMHPETARCFISSLLNMLCEFKNICHFQIVMASHSPLLLSDIPSHSVILLKKDLQNGNCVIQETRSESFAANIHTLLANDFFMASTIGAWAENYINLILKDIQGLASQSDIKNEYLMLKRKIALIGEDIIRYQLEQKLRMALLNCNFAKQQKIDILRKELAKLEQQND